MGMQENCFGTCMMEGRMKTLEENFSKQLDQYLKDRVDSAIQMTETQKDIKSILKIQEEMNTSLNKVLEENQERRVQQAASQNEVPAGRWKSLSAGTRAILITVIGSVIVAFIGYMFSLVTQ